MVESKQSLDLLFAALADATRRDILERISDAALSIGQIAEHYRLTYAAISKHIQVLERANLVTKRRSGKQQVVILVPQTLEAARDQIARYAQRWADRFDQLEDILKEE